MNLSSKEFFFLKRIHPKFPRSNRSDVSSFTMKLMRPQATRQKTNKSHSSFYKNGRETSIAKNTCLQPKWKEFR